MITITELFSYMKVRVPAWITGTEYLKDSVISNAGTYYVCLKTHTSSVFATNLAAGYWVEETIYENSLEFGINFVNTYCNRIFVRTANFEFIFNEPKGKTKNIVFLPNRPINSITSIKTRNATTNVYEDILTNTGDTIENSVILDQESGKVELLNGYIFQKQNKIIYDGGFDTVPSVLKSTAIEIAYKYFMNSPSGKGFIGLTSVNIGGQSSTGMGIDQRTLEDLYGPRLKKFRNFSL